MSILYHNDVTLRERVAECLEDDFKHNAIKTAQEVFYVEKFRVQSDFSLLRFLHSQYGLEFLQ